MSSATTGDPRITRRRIKISFNHVGHGAHGGKLSSKNQRTYLNRKDAKDAENQPRNDTKFHEKLKDLFSNTGYTGTTGKQQKDVTTDFTDYTDCSHSTYGQAPAPALSLLPF